LPRQYIPIFVHLTGCKSYFHTAQRGNERERWRERGKGREGERERDVAGYEK